MLPKHLVRKSNLDPVIAIFNHLLLSTGVELELWTPATRAVFLEDFSDVKV